MKGFPCEITITAVYCTPWHNLKKGTFWDILSNSRNKIYSRGNYNSKLTLRGWRLTTKGRELSKVIRDKNYSFLSTGTPTCWHTDWTKIPDLLDFFVTNGIYSTYTHIQSRYDFSSDRSPTIATLSTSVIVRKQTSRLQTKKTGIPTDK